MTLRPRHRMRAGRWRAALTSLTVLFLQGLMACGNATEESADEQSAGGSCMLPAAAVLQPSCASCARSACCERFEACWRDATCGPLLECVQSCGGMGDDTAGCTGACLGNVPPQPVFTDTLTCLLTQCEGMCTGPG